VGQKLMVRIEEVGRTAAVAVPIDAPPQAAAVEDDVESRPRRRGRRGGRRRSAETEEPLAG
jgi:ribonuclease G